MHSRVLVEQWSPVRTKSVLSQARMPNTSRPSSSVADHVLHRLCSIVTFLALDPAIDRQSVFEQYEHKLRSMKSLPMFCVAVTPRVVGMAMVYGAFNLLRRLRSNRS